MTRDPETLSPARISELQRQAIERGYEINAKAVGSVVVAGVTGGGELVSVPGKPAIAASFNGYLLGTGSGFEFHHDMYDMRRTLTLSEFTFMAQEPNVHRYFLGFLSQCVRDGTVDFDVVVDMTDFLGEVIADKCRVLAYESVDDRLTLFEARGNEYGFRFTKEKKKP